MRLHIEGQHTYITPHVLGWIAQRLEHLNTPHQDIYAVHVTLVNHEPPLRGLYEARVELRWVGQTLHATQGGETLPEAARAAWEAIERTLGACRIPQQSVGYEVLPPQALERTMPVGPRSLQRVQGRGRDGTTRFSIPPDRPYRRNRDEEHSVFPTP